MGPAPPPLRSADPYNITTPLKGPAEAEVVGAVRVLLQRASGTDGGSRDGFRVGSPSAMLANCGIMPWLHRCLDETEDDV